MRSDPNIIKFCAQQVVKTKEVENRRALIKKLVTAENPAKPLSDSKIADLLAEQGIMVARRTIAKYRESLLIPPSNQRKRLV